MDIATRLLLQKVLDNFSPVVDSKKEIEQEAILNEIKAALSTGNLIQSAFDEHEQVPVYNVGILRAALDGLPRDRTICTQVVGKDHSAWNMHCHFVRRVRQGDIAVLQMSHHELPSLNNLMIPDTIEGLAQRIINKTKEHESKSDAS